MNNGPNYHNGKSSITQFFQYAIVGVISNVIGYLIYLLFTALGFSPKIAMSLLYGVGAAIGFYGNRRLAFSHEGSLLRSGVRYSLTHLTGYFINLAILVVFADKLGYGHQYVQAVAIVIVAAFLFTAFKFFVFRNPRSQSNR